MLNRSKPDLYNDAHNSPTLRCEFAGKNSPKGCGEEAVTTGGARRRLCLLHANLEWYSAGNCPWPMPPIRRRHYHSAICTRTQPGGRGKAYTCGYQDGEELE